MSKVFIFALEEVRFLERFVGLSMVFSVFIQVITLAPISSLTRCS